MKHVTGIKAFNLKIHKKRGNYHMDKQYIKTQLTQDRYIDFAFERYRQFKQSSSYDESYKYEILSELNTYLQNVEITFENVVEIINKLRESNPSSGSFVFWSNLSDLHEYASEFPEAAAAGLEALYKNEDVPLNERIESFRNRAKEANPNIRLGAPLFGYMLAAYDYQKYPLYKEEVFQHVKKVFGIKTKLRSVSENYQDFYDLCEVAQQYFTAKGYTVNLLDVQDFFYCITKKDSVKTECAVDFLFYVSNQLNEFKQDTQRFIHEIRQLDRKILEKKRKSYENTEKINKIRYHILDYILNNQTIVLEEIEQIKNEVSRQYDTNILQSWKNFTILFPLYYDSIEEKVKICLSHIHEAIRKLDGLKNIDLEDAHVMKDFNWKQNFGDTHSWLAVYPKNQKTHRTAAQLYFGVFENKIIYGMMYGSEHPKRGEEYLTLLDNAEEFTYEEMRKTFDKVISIFIKESEKSDEVIREPLGIFSSLEEADWAFDFVKESLNKLGINNPGDERVVFTYPRMRSFHVDFARWLIIGFQKGANQETEMKLALLDDGTFDLNYVKVPFKTEENEPAASLVYCPLKDFQNSEQLQNIFNETLVFVKEKFKNAMRSQYRNSNKPQLEAAVFDKNERKKLFAEGLLETSEEMINQELELQSMQTEENKMKVPTISFEREVDAEHLYFENKEVLLNQVKTALKHGKHIILIGPPGTGKSKLAKEICNAYQAEYKMATATSDWSTYETIGGYRPNRDGTLSFKPGLFLNCFKDPETFLPRNQWLIVDEINRSDIDKAFGSLFSALTGDEVTLNFQSDSGKTIVLKPQQDEYVTVNDYEYIIPNDWRMIGTMNTMDKASLYEMSYAFMRRFAFIPVGVPRNIDVSLIEIYLDLWNIADYPYKKDLAFIWENINYYRPIGPAIVEDIANYTANSGDFTSAIILYVLPQFEGVMDQDILEFIERISQLQSIDKKRLLHFCQDFFHVKV